MKVRAEKTCMYVFLAMDAHEPEVELKSLDTDDSLPEDQ